MADVKVITPDDLDPSLGFVGELYHDTSLRPADSVGKVGITDLTRHLPRDILTGDGVIVVDSNTGKARVADMSVVTGVRKPILWVRYYEGEDFVNDLIITNHLPPIPVGGGRLLYDFKSSYFHKYAPLTLNIRSHAPFTAYWVKVNFTTWALEKVGSLSPAGVHEEFSPFAVTLRFSERPQMHHYDPDTGESWNYILCIDYEDTEDQYGLSSTDIHRTLTNHAGYPYDVGIELTLDYKHAPTVWARRVGSVKIERSDDTDLRSSSGVGRTFDVSIVRELTT